MKTLAIVQCGNLVCNRCMWLRDTWCELFDNYPEQCEDDFKPLIACINGRQEVLDHVNKNVLKSEHPLTNLDIEYNEYSERMKEKKNRLKSLKKQIPYKIFHTVGTTESIYIKCPRCNEFIAMFEGWNNISGFICRRCDLNEHNMQELVDIMTADQYKDYAKGKPR